MALVRRVGPASAFKVGVVLYGMLGFIVGLLVFLAALAGTQFFRGPETQIPFTGAAMGIAALIVCPILYGLIGGIVAAIGAALYNLAAGWVGGLEVDIS